jgi:hypothetical protein
MGSEGWRCVMTAASPKLVALAAAWRRLYAEATAIETAGGDSDPKDEEASDVLWRISEFPAASVDDLALKLAIAAEAFGACQQSEEEFLRLSEPPAHFLYPAMREAARMMGGHS